MIGEYKDYVGFSDYVQRNSTFYRPRSWVPRWLWRLVAEEVTTPLRISQEMQRAGEQGLRNLVNEEFILSHGKCDLRDLSVAKSNDTGPWPGYRIKR